MFYHFIQIRSLSQSKQKNLIGQINQINSQGIIQHLQQRTLSNQDIPGSFQSHQLNLLRQLFNQQGQIQPVQTNVNNLLNSHPLELNSRGQHLPTFPQRINLEALKQLTATQQSRHDLGQNLIVNQHPLQQQIKTIENLKVHPQHVPLTKLPLPLTFYRTNFVSNPILHHSQHNSLDYKVRKVAAPILNSVYDVLPYKLKGKRSKEKSKSDKKKKCDNHGTYIMCRS